MMICKFVRQWQMIRALCRIIQEQRAEIAHLEEYAANLNFIIDRLEKRILDNAQITRQRCSEDTQSVRL